MNRTARLMGLVIMAAWMAAGLASGAPIEGIRVEHAGGGVIDEGQVRAQISSRVGEVFDAQQVSRDVKRLQKTERYSEVRASVERSGDGVVVVYSVHPRPTVRRLRIDGADAMSNKKIRELLELGVGDPVDDALLGVKAMAVRESYQKKYYPDAKITWEIDENVETGQADVEVHIEEGRKVRVKKIRFRGNEIFSGWALRKAMTQKKVNIFSPITGRGAYSPEDVEADRLILKKMYLDEGYHDVVIGEVEVEEHGRRNLFLTVPVIEGRIYRLGAISVEGVEVFGVDEVREKALRITRGQVAGEAVIENTEQAIRDFYGSRGYVNTRVISDIDVDPDTGDLDVRYRVREGTLSTIRTIEIRGNNRTKDKVIRRELTIYPGEIFNEVRVRQSERRLRNLGFFSDVAALPRPTGAENEYDLVFEVEEQRSGQFSVGAGFSSVDDIIGFAELSQGNFDLFNWPSFTGGGQKFKIRLQLGTERRDWQVSFIEPWFLDRRLSLGFDVFQHERRFLSDDYDQLNTGGSVSLTRPLRGPYRLSFTYGLEENEVKDVDDDASEEIKQEEGTRTRSSGTVALVRDTRNNVFIPTDGSRTSLSGELAGSVFGGETDLYQLSLRTTHFYPMWYDHVLNLRGRVTTVEEYGDADRVPIFDRLFLGGARTLRGFDFRDVGPKDENGEPIGGKTLVYGTSEYTVPVVDNIRLAAFFDIGTVNADSYDGSLSDLNSDYGIGLRLDIPGFPLQLDYAWPIEADEFNDSSGRFNFFIGYSGQ